MSVITMCGALMVAPKPIAMGVSSYFLLFETKLPRSTPSIALSTRASEMMPFSNVFYKQKKAKVAKWQSNSGTGLLLRLAISSWWVFPCDRQAIVVNVLEILAEAVNEQKLTKVKDHNLNLTTWNRCTDKDVKIEANKKIFGATKTSQCWPLVDLTNIIEGKTPI